MPLRCLLVALLAVGIVQAQPKGPLPLAPQAPTINAAFPFGMQRGTTLEVTLAGTNLADPLALTASFPMKATFPTDANNGKDAGKLRVKIEVPADAPIGPHHIRLATKHGISNLRVFCVDEVPQLDESADNKTWEKAQPIALPSVVAGRTEAEVSDFFKIAVKPGQRLTFEVIGRRLGSLLDPVIKLHDAKTGRELPGHYSDDEPGLQSDCRMTHTFPMGGEFAVEVRDTRHLGGADYFYRLRIAECPAAMTAYPMAVKRGGKAAVGFAGRDVANVPPVEVTMPTDRAAITVAPKGSVSGWPVPVYASDIEQMLETEPNNDAAKAQRLPVPGGLTGRFLEKSDADVYVFAAKKGVKYAITAETYEVLSPAEVYLVIKDAKGADQGKSKPENTPARVDVTPNADGDLFIHAEHLNYLHGPTEVYHLTVAEVKPDFDVQLQLDRVAVSPGGTAVISVAPATRRDFQGPIELTVVGHPGISGTTTVPNAPPPPPGQPVVPAAYLPITCKGDVPVGAYEVRVMAKATIDGKEVTKLATVTDLVKAGLSGLPFPPRQMLTGVGVAVVPPPPFSLEVKLSAAEVVRGTPGTATIAVKRAAGFEDEVQVTPIHFPAGVDPKAKPIAKGATEVQFPLAASAKGPFGAQTLIFRGTAKVGGKDFAFVTTPVTFTIGALAVLKAEPATLKVGGKEKLKVSIVRKGDFKGAVEVEVKNLPANVTAPKATIAPDKTTAEIELTAAAAAAIGDKGDVHVAATVEGQPVQSPNITLKVVK